MMIDGTGVGLMPGTTDDPVTPEPGNEASPAAPARQARPAPAESVELPGDSVCWLRLVCPECGTIAETEPPAKCPQCGALIEAGL
jgi:hypothetical protein